MPGPEDSMRLLSVSAPQASNERRRQWVWGSVLLATTAVVLLCVGRSTLKRAETSGVSGFTTLEAAKAKGLRHGKPHVKVDQDLVWSANQMRMSMQKYEDLSSEVERSQEEEEEHLEAAEKAMLARLEAKEKELERQRKRREEKRKAAKSNSSAHKGVEEEEVEKKREEEDERLKKVEDKLKREGEIFANLKEKKRQRQAKERNASALKASRDANVSSNASNNASNNASGSIKNQSRISKAARMRARAAKAMAKAEGALAQWKKEERKSPNISLYCFSLMMPFGYEPNLLAEQKKHAVGIYACNESAVFSNMTHLLDGTPSPVDLLVVNESLAVPFGGRWMTALNTPVFNKLWMEVLRLARYRYHDWTVKVDPDAVFFPSRLIQLLRHKEPYNKILSRLPEPKSFDKCGLCRLPGHTHETCAAHVHWLQQHSHTCAEAVEMVAREPPKDCGCECDDFACDLPDNAVYLNNCKWGLHGPIEVFSRRAVAVFAAGLPRCVPLLEHAWGEDKFIDQCLQLLDISRDDEFTLLSETACGEQPAPCGKDDVSFHPFKSVQSYFTCHAYASQYGHGPASQPALPNETAQAASHHKDSRDAFVWK